MQIKTFLMRSTLVVTFCAFGFSACGEEPSFSKETLAAADKLAKSNMSNMSNKSNKSAKQSSVRSPFGQNPDEYVLTFADEFDSLNLKLWKDHIWYETSHPHKNYTVEDGKLKIWPQRDASGKFFNRTLDTDGRFEQRYGFFEIEAKLTRGKGTWPAFWLLGHPGKRRPEIDILEAYPGGEAPWGKNDADGVARPTAYGVTVWLDEGVQAQAGTRQYDVGKDLSAGFHRYAVKWEPDRQTFYFDGKPIHTVEAKMTDSKFIILDLWFGSSSGDPDESTPQGKSNSFEINYVRAWQMKRFMNQ